MSSQFKVFCVLILATAARAAYVNMLGQPFDFKCPAGQAISAISSVYDNLMEDRQWSVTCRAANLTNSCTHSGYVNGFGSPLSYTCPGKKVLTGIQSYHDNQVEDRRFNFQCCAVSKRTPRDCHTTSDVNTMGGPLTLEVPANSVIKGAYSVHDVTFEDRTWKFQVCRM
ncbi:dermatopontin-like [Physella acuta]|uniref:dermatopontin-like n=1 Tax=Physella acuta TaxID=109671 RepID=UPI0027DE89E3|nr:dermatopontin-like [Physella acuta]